MSKDDWAIVAGLNHYPGLGDLGGPENDARAFHAWLTSPAGGVPKEQAKLILSSHFQPLADSADAARPTIERIEDEFKNLELVAQRNNDALRGLQVGRRLYIYLAGHGFAPREEESVLLMANATATDLGGHVRGRAYADWFYHAAYFQEILLFMDCCREDYRRVVPRQMIWDEQIVNPQFIENPRPFYGYATQWTRLSREKPLGPNREPRGIFTTVLLKGLEVACEPDGNITPRSLGDYLYENMSALLTPEELKDPQIPKAPELQYDVNPHTPLVIATVKAPTFPVRVHLKPEHERSPLQVSIVKYGKSEVVQHTDAPGPLWEIRLPVGFYLIESLEDERARPLQVNGLSGEAYEVTL